MVLYEIVLARKLRLIANFMMSQTAKQIITTHISFNISRSKCYQTIRSGKLIEYKLRNIFLINNVKNVLEKLIPGHYFEKLK